MASISKRTSGAWQNTSYGIRAVATDTITTLPTTIYGDGTNATVSIKGNTVQNGTPTPESPVMPQGTGQKTANLLFKKIANGGINPSGKVVETTAYDLFVAKVTAGDIVTVSNFAEAYAFYGSEPATGSISIDNTRHITYDTPYTITIPNGAEYIAVRAYSTQDNTMLNTGSTALPYEPYGYKIPISSAGQTTPVYLGETQTTRKIKKLVLDGTETITEESTNVYSIPIADTVTAEAGLSTHFEYDSTVSAGQFRIEAGKAVFGYNDTLANFSTFLAAQYTAGTPVTVWYVLAESETGIVNEPLMKIGDYADEVSGISIPTTDGANTLSIDTTLQPSEVSVNYHGWHMGTVHERTAGQWD